MTIKYITLCKQISEYSDEQLLVRIFICTFFWIWKLSVQINQSDIWIHICVMCVYTYNILTKIGYISKPNVYEAFSHRTALCSRSTLSSTFHLNFGMSIGYFEHRAWLSTLLEVFLNEIIRILSKMKTHACNLYYIKFLVGTVEKLNDTKICTINSICASI